VAVHLHSLGGATVRSGIAYFYRNLGFIFF